MTTLNGRWSPGIGDPTAMGWVTVAAYFGAAALCFACSRRERAGYTGVHLWGLLTVLLVLLGINKQLDLQTWFTQIGRDLALAQGWYAQRGRVQMSFILVLALCALIVQAWLFVIFRKSAAEARLALLGLVFVLTFVVIRAASFHHIDRALHTELVGLRLNWILELSGIGCIALAAVKRLKRPTLVSFRRGGVAAR